MRFMITVAILILTMSAPSMAIEDKIADRLWESSKVLDELMELSENVPGIEDYVAGLNNSPEGLNKGYTHGFVMTFTDAAARDAYQIGRAHV